MLEFKKDSIYDTVGSILASSKEYGQSVHPKGVRQHILFKIYDKHSNVVAEYTTRKDVFKAITRDMHTIGEGYVDCICHSHPRF